MGTIKAVVRGGRIELVAPPDWPDGTEVAVDLSPISPGRVGITESEWRDDPAALADWATWVRSIDALDPDALVPEGDERFEEAFREFNVGAVRRQMAEGPDE